MKKSFFALLPCCLVVLLTAAPASFAEDSKEWTACFAKEKKQTGFDACFQYCKKFTGVNEYNIGAMIIKDNWIKCQNDNKCGYYHTVARYRCAQSLEGRVFPEERLKKLRTQFKILEEDKDKWPENKAYFAPIEE